LQEQTFYVGVGVGALITLTIGVSVITDTGLSEPHLGVLTAVHENSLIEDNLSARQGVF
jgi:hypothetical protein